MQEIFLFLSEYFAFRFRAEKVVFGQVKLLQDGEETAFLTESINGHRAAELSGSLQVLARMRVLE